MTSDELFIKFRLSPMQLTLFRALEPKGVRTLDTLFSALYGSRADPPGDHAVYSLVHGLRQKLRGAYTIKSVERVGYYMEKAA